MKIENITTQIAAMYLGRKCTRISNGWEFVLEGVCGGAYSVDGYVCDLGDITPHLRRIESITEEEARELYKLVKCEDWETRHEWLNRLIGSPATLLYLLSKGFDLFGLIDAGLAKEVTL